MSRHAQLPPRCPLQKKTVAPQITAPISSFSAKDTELHYRQNGNCKIAPESLVLEEQPPWLNDLLSDLDLNCSSTSESRLANDSSTLPNLDQVNEKESTDYGEPDDELGSSCLYGPNSPRRRDKLGFSENEIVSAFSEYGVQNSSQHLEGYSSMSGVYSGSYRDARASADEISYDKRHMKRHPGQRSRARKLQYISELERSVNALQNLGSDLAVTVASMHQQHAALSLENSSLKQQLLRVEQEKFIVDNEYQCLKTEVERLRARLVVSATNKFHSRSRSVDNFTHANTSRNMLDMRKLNLN